MRLINYSLHFYDIISVVRASGDTTMRYLIFLVCFVGSLGLAYFVTSLQNSERSSKVPSVILERHSLEVPSIAVSHPIPSPTPTSEYKWTDLEFQGETTIQHEAYSIENTLAGLTISRNGRRQLFLKNNNDGWRHGVFGLRDLLKNGRRQLAYLSTTGGNHCCAEFVIVDFPKSGPSTIFRSDEYDVQMGEFDNDALMTFDVEGDGRLEITQRTTYGLGGCATVSNPVTYVGFRYNGTLKRYIPMKHIAPVMVDWIAERRRRVEAENELVEKGQHVGSPCGYDSDITAVALSYVYIGRESEGYKFYLENYRALDYSKTPPVYTSDFSRKQAQKTLAEVRRTLAYDRLYGKVYGRRVLRHP